MPHRETPERTATPQTGPLGGGPSAGGASPGAAPLLPARIAIPLALFGGLLLGLSQPLVVEGLGARPIDPTGLSGLLAFVGYVPALLAMRGGGPKRGYFAGFFTSWVQFTIIVYWVVVAMTVFGGIPLPASVAVLLVLTSAMAFYVAAAFAVTRILVGRFQLPQWLVFPAALTAVELLRNYGPLGGFPWGNVGYSLATVPLLRQGAALFGVYGLVFVVALVNGVVADVLASRMARAPLPKRGVVVAASVLVALAAYGGVRLQTTPAGGPTVTVGLLQGNIEQGIKNKSEQNARYIFEKFHALQRRAVEQGADLVVWPEAAFPMRVPHERQSFDRLGLVPTGEAPPPAAVVGVSGIARVKDDDTGEMVRRHSNSAFYLEGFDVVGRVDKTHLVPFGEYVPWPLQSIIRQIVPIGSALPGEGFVPVAVTIPAGGPGEGDAPREVMLGTTICYEGIFPEISRAFARAGAELMINVTNDAWYGVSSAATQHMLMYSLRAIESGRAVARAANTGISGWVDTRGEVHAATDIYTDAALVADVPIATETTLYVLLGEWVAVPCLALVLGGWIVALLGRDVRRRRRESVEQATGVLGLLLAAVLLGWYYAWPGVHGDEGAATRALLGVLAGLLVGVGAFSARPWGRKAQMWVGGLAAVLSLVGLALGAWSALVFTAAGVGLFFVARARRERYVRPADPLVLEGR